MKQHLQVLILTAASLLMTSACSLDWPCGDQMCPAPPLAQPVEDTITQYYPQFRQYLTLLESKGLVSVTSLAPPVASPCMDQPNLVGTTISTNQTATSTAGLEALQAVGDTVFSLPDYSLSHAYLRESSSAIWTNAGSGVIVSVFVQPNDTALFQWSSGCHETNRVWPDGPFDPVTFQPLPATLTTPSSSVSPTPTPTSTESPR